MDDLIRRADVIKALEDMSGGYSYIETPTLGALIKIREISSVQAKLDENTMSEQDDSAKFEVKTGETCTDCISRQAAIDAFTCNGAVFIYGDKVCKAIVSRIMTLPSAQPEKAVKDCRNCKNSRYNDHYGIRFCYESDDCVDWNLWEPSVQPELVERRTRNDKQ